MCCVSVVVVDVIGGTGGVVVVTCSVVVVVLVTGVGPAQPARHAAPAISDISITLRYCDFFLNMTISGLPALWIEITEPLSFPSSGVSSSCHHMALRLSHWSPSCCDRFRHRCY